MGLSTRNNFTNVFVLTCHQMPAVVVSKFDSD